MPHIINLAGQKFGRLTVLEQIKNTKFTSWKCRCSCGNETVVTTNSLKNKKIQSCGCLRKEITIKRMTTHNMSRSPEYKAWQHMKDRCYKPTDKSFKNYGGRGIEVCQEWRDSFLAFYNHIGKRPSSKHSIDRINNNGNYKPGNVRWANRKVQANNSRHNHLITIDGITQTITQWGKATNTSITVIRYRLSLGLEDKEAVFTPPRKQRADMITVNGTSKTTKQWAEHVGISPNAITKRLRRGWSPKDAIFTPVKHK